MKKTITTALIAAASLTLAACGGTNTTENVTVTNEAVVEDGLTTDNFTTTDPLNETGASLDNAAAATENAADATGNAVANATE